MFGQDVICCREIALRSSIRPRLATGQELEAQATDEYVTPCGPPDISCADISEEQMSRTYSQSCIWDPTTNPVPPLQEMEGFGRFRRSVHANADWELSRFRGDLQTLGPAAIQHLGDFEIARLKHGVMDNIRSPSCTSLATRSDPGASSDGPRVCRGFDPSRVSAADYGHKGRSSSMTNSGSQLTAPVPREAIHPRWRKQSERSFLATIDEAAATLERKKIVPLIFDAKGTADEVIDDEEYESCDDSSVPAEESGKAEKARLVSNTSKTLERKAPNPQMALHNRNRMIVRNSRNAEHALDKGRLGQKKFLKSAMRRPSSRGRKLLVNWTVPQENIPKAVEDQVVANIEKLPCGENPDAPPAILICRGSPTSSDGSAVDNPADVGLYMVEQKPRSPRPRAFDPVTSIVPRDAADLPCSSPALVLQDRDVYYPGFRVRSGNIPSTKVKDKGETS